MLQPGERARCFRPTDGGGGDDVNRFTLPSAYRLKNVNSNSATRYNNNNTYSRVCRTNDDENVRCKYTPRKRQRNRTRNRNARRRAHTRARFSRGTVPLSLSLSLSLSLTRSLGLLPSHLPLTVEPCTSGGGRWSSSSSSNSSGGRRAQ